MGRNDAVITKTERGWSINMVTFVLLIIVHVCTLIGLVGVGASQYGSLTTRLVAVETQAARQVAANEAMAKGFSELALELRETRTKLEERTAKTELQGVLNREGIRKNTASIDAQSVRKPKSLLSVLGVK